MKEASCYRVVANLIDSLFYSSVVLPFGWDGDGALAVLCVEWEFCGPDLHWHLFGHSITLSPTYKPLFFILSLVHNLLFFTKMTCKPLDVTILLDFTLFLLDFLLIYYSFLFGLIFSMQSLSFLTDKSLSTERLSNEKESS